MALQRSRTMAAGQVQHARLILLLDESASRRLYARHPGRAPRSDLAQLEARVLEYTLKRKSEDGSTHWSSRKLAAQLGLPFMTVQRIWRKHDIRPHRLDRHMVSNDPAFETKAADVIGLYLKPRALARGPLRELLCVRLASRRPSKTKTSPLPARLTGCATASTARSFATGRAPSHSSTWDAHPPLKPSLPKLTTPRS